jgi:hypothetical protein
VVSLSLRSSLGDAYILLQVSINFVSVIKYMITELILDMEDFVSYGRLGLKSSVDTGDSKVTNPEACLF